MVEEIFKHVRANEAKLKAYGFVETEEGYLYETTIFDEQFSMLVLIDKDGGVSTKVVDINSQDEYVLHLVETGTGEFVGKVRADFLRVLTDIKDKCFEKEVFKSVQSKKVIAYIRTKYGDELEYLWERFPTNAVWRRKDNNKWYGALLVIPKSKLGLKSNEAVEIIDLRIAPDEVKSVVDNVRYFAGYHMNKNNWFTICLDNSVSDEEIFEWIDKSYQLALKK